MANDETLRITLKRSTIGTKKQQRAIIRTLGLKKVGDVVERDNTPDLQGMLRYVNHMVDVETTE